jgi:hypothetical protein
MDTGKEEGRLQAMSKPIGVSQQGMAAANGENVSSTE